MEAVLRKLRGCHDDDVEVEEVRLKGQMIFVTSRKYYDFLKLNFHVQGDERGRNRAKKRRFFLVWKSLLDC